VIILSLTRKSSPYKITLPHTTFLHIVPVLSILIAIGAAVSYPHIRPLFSPFNTNHHHLAIMFAPDDNVGLDFVAFDHKVTAITHPETLRDILCDIVDELLMRLGCPGPRDKPTGFEVGSPQDLRLCILSYPERTRHYVRQRP